MKQEYKIKEVFDEKSKPLDEKLKDIYNDEFKFKQAVYDSVVSIYKKDGKPINPIKLIESMKYKECNDALVRIFPKINLDKIKNLFDEIPIEYDGLVVFSEAQKKLYFESLVYKYEKVFKPIYDKIIK